MQYKSIIGLEIHVQLKTKSKLFCGCDNQSDEALPNTNVCPICIGHPGVLPVLNKKALEFGLMAALALNCKIPEKAKFDRKNYFYPDLPKGYQISMFDQPICTDGILPIEILTAKPEERRQANIRITRIHLEEDAAKLMHAEHSGGKKLGFGKTKPSFEEPRNASYVDYNRAGTPLIEIVTEPDLRSPQEAKIFLQELRRIMRYLKISDADMEKGHLRCDANISLQPIKEGSSASITTEAELPNMSKLHPKTELKNINSFRAVERALQYEIQRQTKLWEQGQPPNIESTRGWNDAEGITVEQRTKEGSSDYRYFPEPDLPPLLLREITERVRPNMVELPQAKRQRFCDQYGFSAIDAGVLTDDKNIADYTEKVIMEMQSWIRDIEEDGTEDVPTIEFKNNNAVGIPTESVGKKWERNQKKLMKLFFGWYTSKLFGLMEKHTINIRRLKITPENFAELLTMLHTNKISSTSGLQILEEMLLTGGDPSQIMEEKKLEQVSNEEEIAGIVQEVINSNPQPVADFQAGKQNALQFLVGQVMKATRGKANPDLAQKLLKKMLK